MEANDEPLLQWRPQLCHLRRQKSPEKKSFESQSPWSAKAEKEDRTRRPVVVCLKNSYSSRYSRWDGDNAWSSQEWKADKSMDDGTGQPIVTSWRKTYESQSSFFHEKTQHDRTEQSVVEKPRDRTRQPVVIPPRETKATANHRWRQLNRIRIVIGIQIILERGE